MHIIIEWLTHQALQVAKATEDLPSFYLEQPCMSYEECRTIRQHSSLPLILDESITNLKAIVQAWMDQAADVIDLKISKLGGISKVKEAIDFCSKMGLAMTIVDAWGSKFRGYQFEFLKKYVSISTFKPTHTLYYSIHIFCKSEKVFDL